MRASIIDLRYHMKDVLSALDRNEIVQIVYHGKVKGEIHPPIAETSQLKTREHEFYGMQSDNKASVQEQMRQIRGDRHHDL